ncbi:hypothetical protein Pcar_3235 [Syntrophotalea carbinolica DSM 2380]|uniref:Uncharacterized protein n=1 Tax=Syntrophotalea carbinolica (strain DSM 2380 / NBRC 103641 / GraBd1) TaxID=338963 RepID=Q0C6T2_SYNC1|nr:hypothetical protein Pcar_3235 [Syntrophotalea carbinolica DSM 2380]
MVVLPSHSRRNMRRKGYTMAKKPNYGYEKRQKELAKKAKKEEKKRKREEKLQQSPEEE